MAAVDMKKKTPAAVLLLLQQRSFTQRPADTAALVAASRPTNGWETLLKQ